MTLFTCVTNQTFHFKEFFISSYFNCYFIFYRFFNVTFCVRVVTLEKFFFTVYFRKIFDVLPFGNGILLFITHMSAIVS